MASKVLLTLALGGALVDASFSGSETASQKINQLKAKAQHASTAGAQLLQEAALFTTSEGQAEGTLSLKIRTTGSAKKLSRREQTRGAKWFEITTRSQLRKQGYSHWKATEDGFALKRASGAVSHCSPSGGFNHNADELVVDFNCEAQSAFRFKEKPLTDGDNEDTYPLFWKKTTSSNVPYGWSQQWGEFSFPYYAVTPEGFWGCSYVTTDGYCEEGSHTDKTVVGPVRFPLSTPATTAHESFMEIAAAQQTRKEESEDEEEEKEHGSIVEPLNDDPYYTEIKPRGIISRVDATAEMSLPSKNEKADGFPEPFYTSAWPRPVEREEGGVATMEPDPNRKPEKKELFPSISISSDDVEKLTAPTQPEKPENTEEQIHDAEEKAEIAIQQATKDVDEAEEDAEKEKAEETTNAVDTEKKEVKEEEMKESDVEEGKEDDNEEEDEEEEEEEEEKGSPAGKHEEEGGEKEKEGEEKMEMEGDAKEGDREGEMKEEKEGEEAKEKGEGEEKEGEEKIEMEGDEKEEGEKEEKEGEETEEKIEMEGGEGEKEDEEGEEKGEKGEGEEKGEEEKLMQADEEKKEGEEKGEGEMKTEGEKEDEEEEEDEQGEEKGKGEMKEEKEGKGDKEKGEGEEKLTEEGDEKEENEEEEEEEDGIPGPSGSVNEVAQKQVEKADDTEQEGQKRSPRFKSLAHKIRARSQRWTKTEEGGAPYTSLQPENKEESPAETSKENPPTEAEVSDPYYTSAVRESDVDVEEGVTSMERPAPVQEKDEKGTGEGEKKKEEEKSEEEEKKEVNKAPQQSAIQKAPAELSLEHPNSKEAPLPLQPVINEKEVDEKEEKGDEEKEEKGDEEKEEDEEEEEKMEMEGDEKEGDGEMKDGEMKEEKEGEEAKEKGEGEEKEMEDSEEGDEEEEEEEEEKEEAEEGGTKEGEEGGGKIESDVVSLHEEPEKEGKQSK